MKNSIKIAIVSAGLYFTGLNANAQSKPQNPETPSVQIEAGLSFLAPVGKANDLYQGGYGVVAQGNFPVTPKFQITASAGNEILKKDKNAPNSQTLADIKHIPLNIGTRFFLFNQLYLNGEAGVSLLTNKNDFQNGKEAAFTYAQQVGYLFALGKKNYLDAGVRYESIGKHYKGGNATNFVGAKLSYNFSL